MTGVRIPSQSLSPPHPLSVGCTVLNAGTQLHPCGNIDSHICPGGEQCAYSGSEVSATARTQTPRRRQPARGRQPRDACPTRARPARALAETAAAGARSVTAAQLIRDNVLFNLIALETVSVQHTQPNVPRWNQIHVRGYFPDKGPVPAALDGALRKVSPDGGGAAVVFGRLEPIRKLVREDIARQLLDLSVR